MATDDSPPDVPKIDVKGNVEALRCAQLMIDVSYFATKVLVRAVISPLQLDTLMAYVNFGQSAVIPATEKEIDDGKDNGKDVSLEQSILPEDEAVIKHMLAELTKQVGIF